MTLIETWPVECIVLGGVRSSTSFAIYAHLALLMLCLRISALASLFG
jgi:hypothetical protein